MRRRMPEETALSFSPLNRSEIADLEVTTHVGQQNIARISIETLRFWGESTLLLVWKLSPTIHDSDGRNRQSRGT